jgi:hypothetical protein
LILSVPRKKKSAKPTVKYPQAHESLNPLDGVILRDEEVRPHPGPLPQGEGERKDVSSTADAPQHLAAADSSEKFSATKYPKQSKSDSSHHAASVSPSPGGEGRGEGGRPVQPIYSDSAHGIYLYQQNCLSVLDAIAAKYPEGRFDMIFADPPYFLLGTCKMVFQACKVVLQVCLSVFHVCFLVFHVCFVVAQACFMALQACGMVLQTCFLAVQVCFSVLQTCFAAWPM